MAELLTMPTDGLELRYIKAAFLNFHFSPFTNGWYKIVRENKKILVTGN